MKGEGGGQTDHAAGHELRSLSQRVIGIDVRVRQLIQATSKTRNFSRLFETRDGCGGNSGVAKLREPRHTPLLEQMQGAVALRAPGDCSGHDTKPRMHS